MQRSTETDNQIQREKMLQLMKIAFWKKWVEMSKPSLQNCMQNSLPKQAKVAE